MGHTGVVEGMGIECPVSKGGELGHHIVGVSPTSLRSQSAMRAGSREPTYRECRRDQDGVQTPILRSSSVHRLGLDMTTRKASLTSARVISCWLSAWEIAFVLLLVQVSKRSAVSMSYFSRPA
jgi:hypothetical protein